MIVKITTTGGKSREANMDSIKYSEKFKTLFAWFWCHEEKEVKQLHIRIIHVAQIEYIK